MSTSGKTRIYMIRHGKAAAGWDGDADPGLDDVGRAQAENVAGAGLIIGGANK